MGYDELTRKSVLAGVLISIGAMFSLGVAGYGSLVQGLCFSVGLFGVLCTESVLFTGRMLSLRYVLNDEISVREMLVEWANVWAYNLAGALAACMLAECIGTDVSAVVPAKASMGVGELFVRAVLCNVMVCLAVSAGRWEERPQARMCACLLPVACFVACGFEHSVADMFYMALGVLSGCCGVVDAVRVIAVATAGNIVGGCAFAWLGMRGR